MVTLQDLPIVLTAVGTFLVVLGGGAKWLLIYIDARSAASAKREDEARAEMRRHLEEEIATLKHQVQQLSQRESIYLKRVLQLETYIQGKQGWEMPTLDGWPPK